MANWNRLLRKPPSVVLLRTPPLSYKLYIRWAVRAAISPYIPVGPAAAVAPLKGRTYKYQDRRYLHIYSPAYIRPFCRKGLIYNRQTPGQQISKKDACSQQSPELPTHTEASRSQLVLVYQRLCDNGSVHDGEERKRRKSTSAACSTSRSASAVRHVPEKTFEKMHKAEENIQSIHEFLVFRDDGHAFAHRRHR
jgi:hypothetical protein